MKKIALITFGCAKNLVDSEVMLGHLKNKGFISVSFPEDAEVIILNTCGFILPAKLEAREALAEAVSLKKKDPSKKIIAVGCYVQRYKEIIRRDFPEIDVLLGVAAYDRIVDAIKGKQVNGFDGTFLYSHESPRHLSTPPGWTYVKISEGCSHRCSYCAIPLIKGPYRSRPPDSIRKEVETLVSSGIKEINLISQDTTYYGRDLGQKEGLVELLYKLLKIKNLGRIRILYGYPEEVTDFLLDIMQEKKICSYLDIPFQHSHPEIIKKMGRGMDREKALALIEKIRKKIPDMALRTSLIVGFPGEGKNEFNHLLDFVRTARFDHIGAFTYSPEENTRAFPLGDPVSAHTKRKRRETLLGLQAGISAENNKKYLHKILPVLVDGPYHKDSSILLGRTSFQAPEVDGMVIMSAPSKTIKTAGTFQKVEIIETDVYDLFGEIV
ncbi:MAG: 30S ribosomal protein S12 methylthiotransferase RimO [Candidatus Aminicenantes bacterium]|nr:30S ribosomal protein S12 methylthiotransferase RimO [Candidatus Aminicenantes bacterium]